jgi:hypothetical protein
MSEATTYEVTPKAALFEQLNMVVTATAALYIAVDLHVSGRVELKPGDYCTIEAKHLDVQIRLPLTGPIQVALSNKKPDVIQITVEPKAKGPDFKAKTQGFLAVVNAIFMSFAVNYYENNVFHVRSRFQGDRTKWPDCWQMGWVVRNCASHGGKVYYQSARPVTWRGLTVSAESNGQPLTDLLMMGDMLVLLIEMEESLWGQMSRVSPYRFA